MSANSRLKTTKIMGQSKTFYRQRIPEYARNSLPLVFLSIARKETVHIDTLVTSRNGDRKIMQFIRIKRRPPAR